MKRRESALENRFTEIRVRGFKLESPLYIDTSSLALIGSSFEVENEIAVLTQKDFRA